MLQSKLMKFASGCCYAACLVHVAGKTEEFGESTEAMLQCVEAGWIGEDGYVNDPVKVLQYLGRPITEVAKVYFDAEGYIDDMAMAEMVARAKALIGCFKSGDQTHFVVMNPKRDIGATSTRSDFQITYDPMFNSRTVKVGKLESLRVFM